RHSCAMFSLLRSSSHPHLPPFPTRRSSDLLPGSIRAGAGPLTPRRYPVARPANRGYGAGMDERRFVVQLHDATTLHFDLRVESRSEEHTSELQSLTNLVCRLLLEKKNDHTH